VTLRCPEFAVGITRVD